MFDYNNSEDKERYRYFLAQLPLKTFKEYVKRLSIIYGVEESKIAHELKQFLLEGVEEVSEEDVVVEEFTSFDTNFAAKNWRIIL